MRLPGALKSDVIFQYKQGFYAVYILLTVIYLVVMQKIPEGVVKDYALVFIVFSDPAMVGFFFIGGIVMLEKQQGVTDYLAVTPLDPREYLVSKSVSLGAVATAATIMITMITASGEANWVLLLPSVFLTSVFFTLLGFALAAGCRTVNGYFIKMVPFYVLIGAPCISIIGFSYSWAFRVFPSVSGLELVKGAFRGISVLDAVICFFILCIWNAVIYKIALKVYEKKILTGGAAE